GRSDRHRRWVPEKLGPGRQIVSQDSPSGVSRFGGQAGTQVSDLTPTPPQNHGSRAGSTTHILPAEYARPGVRSSASAGRYRMAGSGSVPRHRLPGDMRCRATRSKAAVAWVDSPLALDPLADWLVTLEEPGDAANSPAWTVADSLGRVAMPTLVQCAPSAES